jgi:arylsulfatase A-like enzyme
MKIKPILISLFILLGIIPIINFCGKSNNSSIKNKPLPNIVIFLVDTLRADHLSLYNYPKETDPNIVKLAKEGIVFKSAYSCAPWTLPSIVSIMTSRFPSDHGVVIGSLKVSQSDVLLAEHLKSLGYRTGSFYENVYAGSMAGLDRGYDTIENIRNLPKAERKKRKKKKIGWQGKVDFFVQRISQWLNLSKGKPFFLYIHIVNPHNPWAASSYSQKKIGKVYNKEEIKSIRQYHTIYRRLTRANNDAGLAPGTIDNSAKQQEYLEELMNSRELGINLYDATVMDADMRTGAVIDSLKGHGLWNNTLFILLSDHGEEMGEHGAWQHDQSVYNELIHVPLVFHFPQHQFSSTVYDENISLIDIAPTIVDYLGSSKIPSQWDGKSLLPLIQNKQVIEEDEFLITTQRINLKKYYKPHHQTRGNINIVIRQGNWKGIWNMEKASFELYHIKDDQGETHNLSSEHKTLVHKMKIYALNRFGRIKTSGFKKKRKKIKLTKEQETNLKSLGYL